MTQPYTDAEVNAAVAATVDELRARIQKLETYSRADAETIEQLHGRVAELKLLLREVEKKTYAFYKYSSLIAIEPELRDHIRKALNQ